MATLAAPIERAGTLPLARSQRLALPRAIALVLAAYVVARVALVACAAGLAAAHHTSVLTLLAPWDGGYYESIVTSGYPSHVVIAPYVYSTVAFFPGFPLLGKAVSWVSGLSAGWSLVAVSLLAGAAGSLLATLLAAQRWGTRRGMQAGVLVAVFPGAVVDGLVYADGLAVAFCIAALLAAGRRRFVAAGLLGACATATLSLVAVPLVLALATEALATAGAPGRARGRASALARYRGVVAPVLAACGAGGYLVYLWVHTGSPFTWSRAERAWWVHASLPWVGLTAFDHWAFSTTALSVVTWASVVAAAIGLLLLVVKKAPFSWTIFAGVVIAGVTFDGGAWIAPRFLFDAFPLVLACGASLPRRVFWPVAVVSAAAMVLLVWAYSFGNRVFLNL